MIIRQNDTVILNYDTTPRKVLSVEHHYSGDYYLIEGIKTVHTINIIDIESTIQYQRDSKLNHVLDGCHSL